MNSLHNIVPFVPIVQGTNGTISTNEYRYILEKGSKKCNCPQCNKKTFVLYIDTVTGEYLPEQYGRCDRESKCSYNLNPYSDGYSKLIWEQEQGNRSELPNNWKPQHKKAIPQPTPEPVFFDFETFKQTLEPERYVKNTFIQNLFFNVKFPFNVNDVTMVIQLYRLGTVANGERAGAITFPYIDLKGNVRAIQVKQFDTDNHTTGTTSLKSIIEIHHTKNNNPFPEWLEAYIKQEGKPFSCLFGEQLLSMYPSNPVALVEAPKTAVYGTLYFGLPETPESLIWLAVYNKSSFSFDKLKVLKGRFVYVFPDLSKDGNTFKDWETKAKEYESRLSCTKFIFSDLLERLAPAGDKIEGYDLADYLIKIDWRPFRKLNIQEQQPPQPEPERVTEVTKVTHEQNLLFSPVDQLPKIEVFKTEQPIKEQSQNWDNEIKELENYFSEITLPTQPIKLNNCSTILDCSYFIKNHLTTVKANNGNKVYQPYLNRLQELKEVLITLHHGNPSR